MKIPHCFAVMITSAAVFGASFSHAATYERTNIANDAGVYVPAIRLMNSTTISTFLVGGNGLTSSIYHNDAQLLAWLAAIGVVHPKPATPAPAHTNTAVFQPPATTKLIFAADIAEQSDETSSDSLVLITEPQEPELIIEPEEPELVIDPLPEPIVVPLDPEDPNANGPQVCPFPPVPEVPLPDAH